MIKNIKLSLLALSLLCCSSYANKLPTPVNIQVIKNDANNNEYYGQFSNVFELIENSYVDTPEKQKLIDAALNGMLISLDPYSSYLADDEYQDFKNDTKGEFCGIGAEIMYDNNAIKIISPIDDLPAYKAGIKPGDYIIAVDGENVSNLGFFNSVKKMRGLKDSKVVLTVLSGPDKISKDIEIIRDVVKINPIKYHIDNEIAYIKIKTFNEATFEELKKAMDIMIADNTSVKGIILDLRNNPGGLLDQAVQISEYFLPSGVIVSVKGKNEADTRIYSSKRFTPKEIDKPMVVLVNYASASAFEIVAAALQENKRALVLGTTTFGKGVVQSVIPISKDAAVKLTTAKFYTPNGKSIQEKGVIPDIIVESLIVSEDSKENEAKKIIGKYKEANKKSHTNHQLPAKANRQSDAGKKLSEQTKQVSVVDEQYSKDYQYGIAKDIVMSLYINSNNTCNKKVD